MLDDTIINKPERTDREIVLRAFTFFQDAAKGAGLQVTRIQNSRTDDADTISHLWFDWQTLMTHLWRMRKSALLMRRVATVRPQVDKAVTVFDKTLPNLKLYRDIFEHMESYVFEDNSRHYKHIHLSGLQVGSVSNYSFQWAIDHSEISLKDTVIASSKLYQGIKAIRDEAK